MKAIEKNEAEEEERMKSTRKKDKVGVIKRDNKCKGKENDGK